MRYRALYTNPMYIESHVMVMALNISISMMGLRFGFKGFENHCFAIILDS